MISALALISLILIACLTFYNEPSISTFQECANAGYPVAESYPRQCRANGQTFVEEINEGNKQYVSRDLEQCKLILFQCVEGRVPFSDESGCGCKLDDTPVVCTPESRRIEACTAIYAPVCGWFDPNQVQCIRYPCAQTYGNSCEACADEKVQTWIQGECPDL